MRYHQILTSTYTHICNTLIYQRLEKQRRPSYYHQSSDDNNANRSLHIIVSIDSCLINYGTKTVLTLREEPKEKTNKATEKFYYNTIRNTKSNFQYRI
jgi:hypothetical protein